MPMQQAWSCDPQGPDQAAAGCAVSIFCSSPLFFSFTVSSPPPMNFWLMNTCPHTKWQLAKKEKPYCTICPSRYLPINQLQAQPVHSNLAAAAIQRPRSCLPRNQQLRNQKPHHGVHELVALHDSVSLDYARSSACEVTLTRGTERPPVSCAR